MDKLKMMSMDKVQGNIEKIQKMFPNAVTEVLRDGKTTLAVDFDVLKQELADTLIDDRELRYQFTWPDKQKSVLLANTPINKIKPWLLAVLRSAVLGIAVLGITVRTVIGIRTFVLSICVFCHDLLPPKMFCCFICGTVSI